MLGVGAILGCPHTFFPAKTGPREMTGAMAKVVIQFAILVAAVIRLSFASSCLWGGRPGGQRGQRALVIADGMTVAQFGRHNELPPILLQRVFAVQAPADLEKPLTAFGTSDEQILKKTEGLLALRAEHGSKNWVKILVKFAAGMTFTLMPPRSEASNRTL
jgi:hypothetical protein